MPTVPSDLKVLGLRSLAQHSPQLKLGGKLDALRTEELDFQVASLPVSTTGIDVDEFWASIYEIHILVLICALLSLPASNADSERCFSMVHKIDSEDRSHVECTTVVSLLALKQNVDEDCFSFKPPQALFEIYKSAVRQYNEEHGSYSNV